jgi:HPt (histidine-containing phosphotransfer) domain-containing protein
VHISDPTLTLDRNQLKDITLDDEELMREVLTALIDDTGRQLSLLDDAIRRQDSQNCVRLAHYCKGACANVGANRAAATLRKIEFDAGRRRFADCSTEFDQLVAELEVLRQEAETI